MSRGTQVFIIRKILEVILTVLIVTMISFGLMKLSPVDAAKAYLQRNQTPVTTENLERVRSEMGLNRPLPVQYFDWLKNALHGDFGKSYVNSKAVLPQELSAFSFTAIALLIQDTYYDYVSPTQWFGAIEYMAQGISLPLPEDSETFMSMVHEFKTIDEEARLIETSSIWLRRIRINSSIFP